ncbi:hypothetical protein VTP01DRAFT_6693 [Rhizomucor pusillus]|uniref:uncharacterized protein n=1 Tax=Rhizomucor pusillus TaxID=4840 RepID=UPI0037437341
MFRRQLALLFVAIWALLSVTAFAAPVEAEIGQDNSLLETTDATANVNLPEKRSLVKRARTYKGKGTWFIPEQEGGIYGACGPKENSESMIVAMNAKQYGNMNRKSKWCGKKLKVKGPNGSAIVKVNDACPGCGKNSLDLTPKVFKKVIGDFDIGIATITWHEV